MKYTKEQVISSLELHNWSSGARCKNCSYKNHVNCTTDLLTDAIALLKDTTVEKATWLPKNFTSFDIEKIGFNCSKCNTTWDVPTNYCPHCGAKMIKEA